jgi:hypothetical protein
MQRKRLGQLRPEQTATKTALAGSQRADGPAGVARYDAFGWPVITMGAALEAGKLVAAAWLTEHWHSAPSLLRLVLVAMIGVLMSLNAVGVFGFLTRAHLDHLAAVNLALADGTAETDARLAIQGQTVADLDRRIAQICNDQACGWQPTVVACPGDLIRYQRRVEEIANRLRTQFALRE